MKDRYLLLQKELKANPKVWLITGVAGFIGSNILESLLKMDQIVYGIDNFSTGSINNLKDIQNSLSKKQWKNFIFEECDICNIDHLQETFNDIDYVLHQAALGSVPRSIKQPLSSHDSNVNGFLNVMHASMEAKVKSFTYASSSSVYGTSLDMPKVEGSIGDPLSPYAATKYINEVYANVFSKVFDFHTIGLRYFNVFGKRQDPAGPYAAVIPKWINLIINNESIEIFGDGKTTRDFCYIDNVVQANILAATASIDVKNKIYNIAFSQEHTLNYLFQQITSNLNTYGINYSAKPIYRDFRKGDINASLADISLAKKELDYNPKYNLDDGIKETIEWFIKKN